MPISVQELQVSTMDAISSREETWFSGFYWRGRPTFHKHLKRNFPSGICMWEGTCVLCFKWNWPQVALTRKKHGFPCRDLIQPHRSYHKMKGFLNPCRDPTESPSLPLISTGGHTSFWNLEWNAEFSASKVDDAWLLYIVRNPNITMPTRKWPSVSRLMSRSVQIALPSLV